MAYDENVDYTACFKWSSDNPVQLAAAHVRTNGPTAAAAFIFMPADLAKDLRFQVGCASRTSRVRAFSLPPPPPSSPLTHHLAI